MSITELKFPNLGLGYYAITIAFLLLLLYKSRDGVEKKTKDKYERILFTTLISIFLFLLICIMITDIDLLKDAAFGKYHLPFIFVGFFNFIQIYRNLLVVIVLVCFLVSITIYLYIEFYQKKTYKNSKIIFFGIIAISILLEIYDFGSHYAKKEFRNRVNNLFTKEFVLAIKNMKKYKYLVVVDREYLPEYTSGVKKELLDFATYENLMTNIGLYARNDKKNKVLYYDKEKEIFRNQTELYGRNIKGAGSVYYERIVKSYKYDIFDDVIYVFERPCFVNCLEYDLTFYAIKNYIIGVKEPIPTMNVKDDDVEGKTKEEREKTIKIDLKPINNIEQYVAQNSKHDYALEGEIDSVDGKNHRNVISICKYCGQRAFALDSGDEEKTHHLFSDYVEDENEWAGTHGTRTAICICGRKDSESSPNGILGHSYVMTQVQDPTNDLDVISKLKCKSCDRVMEGTEKHMAIEIEYSEIDYDGEKHDPMLIVKDKDGRIVNKYRYDLLYKNDMQVGEGSILVTFNDDKDGEYFSFTVYYNILPNTPQLDSAIRDNMQKVIVECDKVKSRYDGYEIELSDTKSFDIDTTVSYEVKRKSSNKLTLEDVDLDKKYVRVRTYKLIEGGEKTVYSKWSDGMAIE